MRSVIIKPAKNTIIEVVEDTQFVLDLGELNRSGLFEETVRVELLFGKQGVSAEIIGIYSLSNAFFSLETVANHLVPNTSCNTKIRAVLMDKAKSKYVGKIIIDKKAQQTSSFLDDNVLVVGTNTHNESEPVLEIEADDVKASHGATTGAIDSNQVYYLNSRGLDKEEAKSLIIEGFFEGLLSEIKDEAVRLTLRKKLLHGSAGIN